jgi:hypothetical protein
MSYIDWDAEAVATANCVRKHMFDAHRGAMLGRQIGTLGRQLGIGAIFGNDNFSQDARSRNEVDTVRSKLAEMGVKILGFGVSDPIYDEDAPGLNWAILVSIRGKTWTEYGRSIKPSTDKFIAILHKLVCDAGRDSGFDNANLQSSIATKSIKKHRWKDYFYANWPNTFRDATPAENAAMIRRALYSMLRRPHYDRYGFVIIQHDPGNYVRLSGADGLLLLALPCEPLHEAVFYKAHTFFKKHGGFRAEWETFDLEGKPTGLCSAFKMQFSSVDRASVVTLEILEQVFGLPRNVELTIEKGWA